MSKSPKYTDRILRESELERLRLRVEQLEDKVKQERRQRHLVEEELAFVRQQQVEMARRRLNGVHP